MKRFVVMFLAFMMAASFSYAKEVKIGALADMTGGTADVGKPYADGVRDCVKWFNDNGGLNGDKIKLIMLDYGYKIPQAIADYKKFKREKVVAIHGWGTGDTEALTKFITKDKIPYFSASYSEHLTFAKKNPYNFLVGVTYSDQARIALRYIKKSSARKTVAFIYNNSGFGRSPFFPDGENYAKKIGVNVVDKEVVGLKSLDSTSQLLNMEKHNPEYALIQETYMAAATVLKDAKRLGIKTKFIGFNWTFGKTIMKLAGSAAEGYMATNPFALWTDTNIKGIKFLHDVNKKYHPSISYRKINYIQGFSSMYVMLSGLKMANKNYKGENLKKIYESMKNFDTMGLTAPVTFTSTSHKGLRALKIYKIKNGIMKPITGYISVE